MVLRRFLEMKNWFKVTKMKREQPPRLDFLCGKRILVTGAHSMIGACIVEQILKNTSGATVFEPTHSECDFTSQNETHSYFKISRPNYVIHLASLNGNIQFNGKYPADIFYVTSQAAINVLRACVKFNVKKVLSILSSCSYPANAEGVYKEEMYWNGCPDSSVESHGFAKRIIPEFGRQLAKQFGLRSISLVYNTVYGPGDSFDIDKTKVIAGLIKKFCDAKNNNYDKVEVWGSGLVRREFIHVWDVAVTLLRAMIYYEDCITPLNIGCGIDYEIRELSQEIAKIIGFSGEITYNKTKPDGAKRKLLKNDKMKRSLSLADYRFIPLTEGLKETIKWYQEQ